MASFKATGVNWGNDHNKLTGLRHDKVRWSWPWDLRMSTGSEYLNKHCTQPCQALLLPTQRAQAPRNVQRGKTPGGVGAESGVGLRLLHSNVKMEVE